MAKVTSQEVRALREDRPMHGVVTCWTGNGPTSEANAELYRRAPDIADAYLTEHNTSEHLRKLLAEERGNLGAHTTKRQAAIEWREGVPEVEDVRAHARCSVQSPDVADGLWVWDPEPQCPSVAPQYIRVGVADDGEILFAQWDEHGDEWVVFDPPFSGHDVFIPADTDTKLPVPWTVHDTITTNVLDSEPLTGPRLEPVELGPLADGVDEVDTDLCISTTASGDCEGVADVQ